MVRRGTILCPTTEAYHRIAHSAVTGNAPDYAVRKVGRVVQGQEISVRMALATGIPIIAGTDAGAPGMPHPTLVDELERLVAYGLTTHQAVQAATSTAADALGRDSIGRIRTGARADLVMTDVDPLASVTALRKIWGVVRSERFIRSRF